jgi:hypothetical protein
MSSVSEQDHVNPRDPSYYAPRWLRERPESRPASLREAGSDTPFSPASFDSQLESAVSDALRHPLDPEIMQEPGYADGMEPRKALWSITARFAAAIGVSALVALFFVIVVPISRQADGYASAASGVVRSLRTALFESRTKDQTSKPMIDEFKPILATAPAASPAASEQSEEVLKQFIQWREKSNSRSP